MNNLEMFLESFCKKFLIQALILVIITVMSWVIVIANLNMFISKEIDLVQEQKTNLREKYFIEQDKLFERLKDSRNKESLQKEIDAHREKFYIDDSKMEIKKLELLKAKMKLIGKL